MVLTANGTITPGSEGTRRLASLARVDPAVQAIGLPITSPEFDRKMGDRKMSATGKRVQCRRRIGRATQGADCNTTHARRPGSFGKRGLRFESEPIQAVRTLRISGAAGNAWTSKPARPPAPLHAIVMHGRGRPHRLREHDRRDQAPRSRYIVPHHRPQKWRQRDPRYQ